MKKNLKIIPGIISLLSLSFWSCQNQNTTSQDYTQYVNPMIGSGGHGHVFVGANVPFGAIQVGPSQLPIDWDWCSGYHASDSTIYGFAQTHLSGTGIGDLGDIVLMPVTQNNLIPLKGISGQPNSGYYSTFSHQDEVAKPGYYSVILKRYNVKAEVTATPRVAFHQYTFPKTANAQIILDLQYGIGWDAPAETHLEKVNDSTVKGYRFSKGWAANQKIFFTAVFDKKVKNIQLYDSTAQKNGLQLTAQRAKVFLNFGALNAEEKIKVKVAISPVNSENALLNMQSELPHWNFENTLAQARESWNEELGKIEVSTLTPAQKTTFYTALYHTMVAPSIFNDVNGDYMGTDKKVYQKADFTNYTTFSLWDTYRAAQPLYTLVHPDRVNDIVKTMLAIYDQQGKLPVWHLMGNETDCMVGNSGVQVVADAITKGFKGFDVEKAYEAMKKSEQLNFRGINYANNLQYIPSDKEPEAVAKALEYAIADGSILQIAKKLGKTEDIEYWTKRSKLYHQYFDTSTQFFRGKNADGKWVSNFNPFESKHRANDYTEGTAWQYLWLVPQDVEGLIKLLGGEEIFEKRLDSLFTVTGDMGTEASPDISGLIGQYAHGNEPSHHVTYLYNYIGKPHKTADLVRQVLTTLYSDQIDGLSGNEDVGQMSAWYVLSAMGFYQVHPSNGLFVFGSPIINEATLHLPQNKKFHILVKNNNEQNKYIQSIELNGATYTKSYISYEAITKGGELQIEMGSKPSKTWGVKPEDRPVSFLK